MKTYSITETFVERLPRPGKEEKARFYFDKKATGFGVKVYYSGSKVFGIRIAMKGNKARWLRIGTFRDPWIADSAREEARKIKQNVENGLDPFAHRAPRHASLKRFQDLADGFFEYFQNEVRKGRRAQSTHDEYKRQWDRNIPQELKLKSVVSLKQSDFKKLHDDITNRNPERPLTVEANRTIALLGSLFTWALGRDPEDRYGLTENLAKGVSKNPERGRGMWMEDPDQARLLAFLMDSRNRYSNWWQAELKARRAAKFSKPRRPPVKRPPYILDGSILDALLLCFLGGLRHCEVRAMRWEQVEESRGVIKVPIKKRGAAPGVHDEFKTLFITQEIKEVLDRLPKVDEWVFPSLGRGPKTKSGSGHLENLQSAWNRVRTHLGLPDVRIHDFRHTVASELGDMGNLTARELKEAMGWKTTATALKYLHSRDHQRQAKIQEITKSRVERLSVAGIKNE